MLRSLDCWKCLIDFDISITFSVSNGSSWNLQITWMWKESQTSSKPGQIAPFVKELRPLDCEKKKEAFIWLYHQRNSFNFDWIILELADKVEMDEVLNEFKNCPDQVICFRVTTIWFLKMPIFDLVIRMTPPVLIRSSLMYIKFVLKFWWHLDHEVIQCILFWDLSTPKTELSLFIKDFSDFVLVTVRPWGDTVHIVLRSKYTKDRIIAIY